MAPVITSEKDIPLRGNRPASCGQEKLKGVTTLWLLLPVVIFLLMVAYVFPYAVDDAYISLRYAENWGNGYGPVFNPGERVEGYTNFLLVAVEMLLFRLGLEDLLPVKIFSILCGIALLAIVELFTWKRHRSISMATCAGLLVGTSAPLALWTVGGLETTLFTSLVTAGIILEVLWLQGSLPNITCSIKGLVLFMAVLTRPDAAIFVALVAACDFVQSLGRRSWSGLLIFLVSFSVPAVIYLAWKLHFYGDIIPIPVYTKIPAHSVLYTFMTGGAKFLSFLVIDLNAIFIAGMLYAMFLLRSKGLLKVRLTNLSFILISTATCAYAVYLMSLGFHVASDEAYRYYVPLVPLMTVVLVLIWPEGGLFQSRRAVFVGFALVCAMVGIRAVDLWWMWNKDYCFGLATWCYSGKEQVDILNQANIAAGKWLRANANPNDSIVLYDAGAEPYFSKLRTIDTWSLTDPELAKLKRLVLAARSDEERLKYSKAITQYVIARNPTFIVQDKGALSQDPIVREKYKPIGVAFSSTAPVRVKNTLNPFAKCRPHEHYVLELRKRVN